MGMTLWVHVLNGRKISGNKNDCSMMYQLADYLDKLCQHSGLPKLSSFFDYTDLEANMGEDEQDDDLDVDPETGWSYGIDDMKWFEATAGLQALQHLENQVRGTRVIPDLPKERRNRLLKELHECIEELQPAARRGQRFHLAVIM
jgi:hypothetical protein